MTNQTDVRESFIMSFSTDTGRTRNLSVPDPKPAAALDESVARLAGAEFILSDIFDPADRGRLAALDRAVRETVTTTTLF